MGNCSGKTGHERESGASNWRQLVDSEDSGDIFLCSRQLLHKLMYYKFSKFVKLSISKFLTPTAYSSVYNIMIHEQEDGNV